MAPLSLLSLALAALSVFPLTDAASPLVLKQLNSLAKKNGRYFGTAINDVKNNNDTKYLKISSDFKEFGVVTPENYMKWFAVEPTRGVFNFTGGDSILKWAHANGQGVRGHTFAWHSQLPDWLNNGTWDAKTLSSILVNHIQKLGGHYKGLVYCWDVVNEPFNDDGTWRTTLWYNIIGPTFIPLALETAHKVDSKAKLYINDYNVEGINPKSDAHYKLAKTLLKQKVPLHGFGLQGHLVVGTLPTDMPANVARFAKLGLEWAFTEVDIRMDMPDNVRNATIQALDYVTVVNTCTGSPACVGIQVWETSDDYSWIPGVFPTQGDALLFDADKEPKPDYYLVANALANAKTSSHFKGFWH